MTGLSYLQTISGTVCLWLYLLWRAYYIVYNLSLRLPFSGYYELLFSMSLMVSIPCPQYVHVAAQYTHTYSLGCMCYCQSH